MLHLSNFRSNVASSALRHSNFTRTPIKSEPLPQTSVSAESMVSSFDTQSISIGYRFQVQLSWLRSLLSPLQPENLRPKPPYH
jgi:hypothetical protein